MPMSPPDGYNIVTESEVRPMSTDGYNIFTETEARPMSTDGYNVRQIKPTY